MAGEITTIARPYAEAVFERAAETGQVDQWSRVPGDACAAIAADPQMAAQIANPNMPARADPRHDPPDRRGCDCRANSPIWSGCWPTTPVSPRCPRSPRSTRSVGWPDRGCARSLVRSAFPVDADQEQDLAKALARRFGAQVELTVEEDPDLIGGVEIRAGDLVIDDSVRGKLKQLSNALQF